MFPGSFRLQCVYSLTYLLARTVKCSESYASGGVLCHTARDKDVVNSRESILCTDTTRG